MTAAPRATRLSGSESAPRWRGRLHLAALTAAVPATSLLVWRDRSPAAAIYGAGLVALFTVSTCYHLLRLSPARRGLLRRADHATIYLYMAAAYTPFCLAAVRGTLGWVVLGLAWAGAAAGVAMKLGDLQRTRVAAGALYMMLGWLAVVTLPDIVNTLDATELALLVASGITYTTGAAVLAARWPDPVPDVFGYHEVWHVSVVIATACYFAVIWGMPGLAR